MDKKRYKIVFPSWEIELESYNKEMAQERAIEKYLDNFLFDVICLDEEKENPNIDNYEQKKLEELGL